MSRYDRGTGMESCLHCRGSLVRARREQERVVGDTCFMVRSPAAACKRCHAVFLPADGLAQIDLAVACELALRAPPSGEGFRFIRRALGLKAMDLALLLRVTPETVSRWENDQRMVDANAWISVGALALERASLPTQTLQRLVGLQKSKKLPRTVHLDPPAPASRGRASSPSSSKPASRRRPKVA